MGSDEPKKNRHEESTTTPPAGQPAPDGAEQERPTVSPPFDPAAFAKEANAHTRATPAGGFSPPEESDVERARQRAREVAARRATPTGALSLANARIPSNLPPPPSRAPGTGRRITSGELRAVDEEFGELELSTRPPPPGHAAADFDIPSQPPARRIPSGDEETGVPTARPKQRKSIREEAAAEPTAREMHDRVALGDYTGALEIAEKLLAIDPHDREATACLESCKTVLTQMYTTKIGPLDRVPVVAVARDQLRWLSIDHRAGFVLSLVDGVSTLEMILDVSGMPQLDTLRILSELAQQRIISFR